jgi:hypothetical protein
MSFFMKKMPLTGKKIALVAINLTVNDCVKELP